jgi:hypothetical protein
MGTNISEVPAASNVKLFLRTREENSSEILIAINQNTWRHIPEDCDLNIHRRENLKSQNGRNLNLHTSAFLWIKI